MKKTAITTINDYIAKGLEERTTNNAKACSSTFLAAWQELLAAAPASYTDYTTLVADFNSDGEAYDWYAWVWDVCEELDLASRTSPECVEERLLFIESFKARFPDTDDEDLQEFLQRNLIKSNFLLYKQAEGEQAVADFYEQFPFSVWGYIEWGDALLNRKEKPSPADLATILSVYKKGLTLEDDPDYMDILKRRIKQISKSEK